jgi:hypothetical protein
MNLLAPDVLGQRIATLVRQLAVALDFNCRYFATET